MSRVPNKALAPPTSLSRAPSPSKPSAAPSTPLTPRVRTKSIPKSPSKSTRRPPPEEEPLVPKKPVSIKAAIALKRAEAKKAVTRPTASGGGLGFDNFDNLEDAIPGVTSTKKEEDDNLDLGRWSVQETIARARSTGSINLVSRSLPCLPSALFEIHLGVKPDALKSVPEEPSISSPEAPGRRPGQREGPAWFEAQDLQVLKAWNNEIIEIQHEISLFGSLKTVDLHQNKISALPSTFADLTALTNLDLSHNLLTSLPVNIFALPTLTSLNLSHNALVALPFGSPFSGSPRASRTQTCSSGSFFGPVITRATSPLPRLLSLDVSFNKLTASAIDHENLPCCLSKVDLTSNPIAEGNSGSSALIRSFGVLSQMKELRLANADIGDDAFPPSLFSWEDPQKFPSLCILDLEETRASAEAVKAALAGLQQSLSFDMTTDEPVQGTVRITVGKKVLKETWEIEAERRSMNRGGRPTVVTGTMSRPSPEELVKEAWEIEAEQGLLTEGGRRRARAAAAAAAAAAGSPTTTIGAPSSEPKRNSLLGVGRPSTPSGSLVSAVNLGIPQYYHAATQTLTLPPLAPPTRPHTRSFSLAASALSPSTTSGKTDIALPTPSLPIATISTQSFAQTLKILVLSNRKLDLSVSLPSCPGDMSARLIPTLEELVLDGCGFGDNVSVIRQAEGGSTTPHKSGEAILPLLTRLFPSLRTLDLSYNSLTSAALQKDVLTDLIMASSEHALVTRKGLRHLRLRGNHITDLDGFQEAAEIFKGHRVVPDWKLEELDLRDNEIFKLPGELGLLPLDVFLVDGNV
ncbi:hypothetical protein PAXRUDRAFT_10832 [Paxillus rubicundulus Ve08.2h10]|uniref:Unplaced genomic scaffold scaffold_165, whole genome shotgun sequence n=1 Tax=Paxillus rubicundulus Ve08.2h10 TaxID=930991 RepID=A0A0D0EAA0_9AGAM|nr:hypothetical protein PAXRUDRAFT_10832 [Paxillus rubicundulus Ve08.2h10]